MWRKNNVGKKSKVTVYLDAAAVQRLDRAATRSGIARGEIIERALYRLDDEVLELGPVGAERKARYLRARGHTIEAIAMALNYKGYLTSSGKPWSYSSVQRMLAD